MFDFTRDARQVVANFRMRYKLEASTEVIFLVMT